MQSWQGECCWGPQTCCCFFVDFDLEKFTVENAKSFFEGKDVVFCCLGTTRAAAKRMPGDTAENFCRIDLHLVVRSAEIAKAAGVRHFSLVGAMLTAGSFSGEPKERLRMALKLWTLRGPPSGDQVFCRGEKIAVSLRSSLERLLLACLFGI
eukprot:m.118690 g.118690  ORF g.118690 m.118690 type:complete len:152 (+) comp37657_c0_seq1:97-552(+)